MSNPDYVTTLENQNYVLKNIPKYSLTQGIMKKNIGLLVIKLLKIFQK